MKIKKHYLHIIITYLVIALFGAVMIWSTTFKNNIANGLNPYTPFLLQILYIIIVLCLGFLIIKFNKKIIKLFNNSINIIFYINLIALLLVLTPIGSVAGGANSMISLGPIGIQPMEWYKITVVFYLAKYFNDNENPEIKDYFIWGLGIPFIGVGLILLEPDLGGTIIISLLILIMNFINTKYLKELWRIFFGLVALAIPTLWILGSGYQLGRISAWLNPFGQVDTNGILDTAANNLIQSYVAISSGGLFGSGLGSSVQKTGYLFASNTDFVFSIIANELGIIGVTLTIAAFIYLIYLIIKIGIRSKNIFDYNICFGIALIFLIQTIINMGGVTGVIPMTGVTLPFISVGLNSFMSLSFVLVYIILIDFENNKRKKNEYRK